MNKFSPEVRERAVRMVQEHRDEYPSLWAAVESIAPKIGCVPQTLLEWVKRDEVDSGTRPGVSSADVQRVKVQFSTRTRVQWPAQPDLDFACPPMPGRAQPRDPVRDQDVSYR